MSPEEDPVEAESTRDSSFIVHTLPIPVVIVHSKVYAQRVVVAYMYTVATYMHHYPRHVCYTVVMIMSHSDPSPVL